MTSAVSSIDRALQQVDAAVEKVLNDQEQRFPEAASVGDAVRQGDIYIQKIEPVTDTPVLYRKLEDVKYPLQLAPGNTKGSRHMLETDESATVYVVALVDRELGADSFEAWREAERQFTEKLNYHARSFTNEEKELAEKWQSETQLVAQEIADALNFCGPVFNLTKEAKITHPEHGDWALPPGSYRITFQRTVDSDMRIRRVLD